MRGLTFERCAWIAVGAVTVLRMAMAALLPLTGDEAYYWEWSRRLAAGYIDHPPAVAFAIAAFSLLGRSPFAVRCAFVLCGLGTALAAGGAADTLFRDRRAGALAALGVTIAPMMIVTFGIASPEGPAALFWALTLYCAAKAFERPAAGWFCALGAAMGGALLSHFLDWALVAGVTAAAFTPENRTLWRKGLWISYAVALLCYAPFLFWNAQHAWISFTFAMLQRHPFEVQIARPLLTYLLCALAFSPGLWLAATTAGVRERNRLLAYTALPLTLFLLVLSFHERVEAYWFTGPYVSLCAGLGTVLRTRAALLWTLVPAAVVSGVLLACGIAPVTMYGAASHAGLKLRNGGPFEIFTYGPLAQRVRELAASRSAIVMTDGYGFSSVIDFYANLPPVIIGYDAQGASSHGWYTDADKPKTALFVDKAPLDSRADFARQLRRACGRVSPGPVLDMGYRTYYTSWCTGMRQDALSILRFAR